MATRRADDDDDVGYDRFIVLLRHGIAEEAAKDKPDVDRSLTPEGHARMKQIAKGLERVFPRAQVIYSSPLVRAVQTSLWLTKGYRSRIKVMTSDALKPEATKKQFEQFVESVQEKRAIIVGHEPNLTTGLESLVGLAGKHRLELKKGGCYGVRLRTDGSAAFEWLLSPRILRRLAEEG